MKKILIVLIATNFFYLFFIHLPYAEAGVYKDNAYWFYPGLNGEYKIYQSRPTYNGNTTVMDGTFVPVGWERYNFDYWVDAYNGCKIFGGCNVSNFRWLSSNTGDAHVGYDVSVGFLGTVYMEWEITAKPLPGTDPNDWFRFSVDPSPPSTTKTDTLKSGSTLAPGVYSLGSVVEVNLNATDNGNLAASGVLTTQYKINNSDWQAYSNPFTISDPDGGTYSITYRSIDNLYNTESESSYTIAFAPEPISSILFVTGGSLLAGRRFLRRKA
jgi:hypothetical protein